MIGGRLRSSVGQRWVYPLSRPSSRFDSTNDLIRISRRRWDDLTPLEQEQWIAWGGQYPWGARCIPWIFDYDPLTPKDNEGMLAFVGVQVSNWANGLPESLTPPTQNTRPASDTLSQVGSTFVTVVWGGRPSAPAGDFMVHVRGVGLNHEPESGPSIQRFTWLGAGVITYGANLDLAPFLAAKPGLTSMPFIMTAVSIMDKGSAPWFGSRIGFGSPYS